MKNEEAERPDLSHVETWVFDMDNTLYSAEIDLFAQIDQRMGEFIAREFNISFTEARQLQKKYYGAYGTTLTGLIKHHEISPDAYMDFVHDIDLSAIDPNPVLDRLLGAIQGRKIVFTNASLAHAERIMSVLNVAHHFDEVFDSADASFVPKHEPDAFYRFVAKTGIETDTAAMFDDLERNLAPARALGMTTVWVRAAASHSAPSSAAIRYEQLAHINHIAENLESFLGSMQHRGEKLRPAGRQGAG